MVKFNSSLEYTSKVPCQCRVDLVSLPAQQQHTQIARGDQIMQVDNRLGFFEEVVANTTPEVRQLMTFLRNLIIGLHPEVVEVPCPGEGFVLYGIGPKKVLETYAYLMPQSDCAKLGFCHGRNLKDPQGLLEGNGLQYMKLYDLERAGGAGVRQLILESIYERKKVFKP
jgi:hypothetical protein